MTILYGIKNCDSVKKAKKWLEQENIPYQFHDFKTDGLSSELLQEFITLADLTTLLNKRSTTFRNLSDEIKNNLTEEVMIENILAQPTLVKRPLIKHNQAFLVGFKDSQYQETFCS
ncbi:MULTISPECIES: ArsC family reductase [unclassified Colwellia]|jgi:arsenate reductase|uniref:ArsC family reductase n=1 Tax=unclassified Colwellia TaxID=196834 RepID=UPI000D3A9E9A|nr:MULTISPECIES: ArsC family reductase [unclassified Colwellia]AWB57499.1 ArsC family reductase [Colwellia sp. Arc7-D]MBA6417331.1 ArsC family reductase [Colwellia sp. 6M3]|tara:strand:- start:3332 stop:3679 length:348 start_codon:yes stop_codon:yes gene_type:complete